MCNPSLKYKASRSGAETDQSAPCSDGEDPQLIDAIALADLCRPPFFCAPWEYPSALPEAISNLRQQIQQAGGTVREAQQK